MKHIIPLIISAILFSSCSKPMNDDFVSQSAKQIKKDIENKHPAAYYILAQKLFDDEKKDDAVFWFYTGQIRYRYHLVANPDLEPSGDPALFSSFSVVIGSPINEYAFGDIPKLSEIITKSLEWDKSHPNGFTPKDKDPVQYEEVRSGLQKMLASILEQQDLIIKQRE